jgi:hypothetical protein
VKVELAPYQIIDFEFIQDNVKLVTNLNFEFILNLKNTTRLISHNDSLIPLVNVRSNIEGFFNRNTYYKLIDFALENKNIDKNYLYIQSDNQKHIIGKIA